VLYDFESYGLCREGVGEPPLNTFGSSLRTGRIHGLRQPY